MIQMIHREGEPTHLAIFCDYCHKEITDPRYAMYAWRVNKEDWSIADGAIYFLHKGICDHATTDADNDHKLSLYDWHWEELDELPGVIMQTLKITWENGHPKHLEEDKDPDGGQKLRQELREWQLSAYPQKDNEE